MKGIMKNQKGFTLIELFVLLFIFAVMCLIASFYYHPLRIPFLAGTVLIIVIIAILKFIDRRRR